MSTKKGGVFVRQRNKLVHSLAACDAALPQIPCSAGEKRAAPCPDMPDPGSADRDDRVCQREMRSADSHQYLQRLP